MSLSRPGHSHARTHIITIISYSISAIFLPCYITTLLSPLSFVYPCRRHCRHVLNLLLSVLLIASAPLSQNGPATLTHIHEPPTTTNPINTTVITHASVYSPHPRHVRRVYMHLFYASHPLNQEEWLSHNLL